MTAALAARRRGQAAWIAALAVVMVLAAWLVVSHDAQSTRPPESPGLVAPDFATQAGEARLIVVTTADQTYRIARTAKGWAMKDRGDYPVRRDRLALFTKGLTELRFDRAMTRDPKKHDRLGLGDPATGGEGVAVQVQDAQGALLANLVLGVRPGALYVRRATDDQAWLASGELPPLRDVGPWLDLSLAPIAPERIARVDIAPPSGPGYAIVRDGEGAPFALGRPFTGLPIVLPGGVEQTAAGLTRLSPIDVAPAPSVNGVPQARLVLRTFDGLVLAAELFAQGDKRWLKLGARSEQAEGPAVAEAAGVNQTSGPWAYGLTEADYVSIAPPLDILARRPAATTAP